VILVTACCDPAGDLQEEAKEVTGQDQAEAAAQYILNRPGAKTDWCAGVMMW